MRAFICPKCKGSLVVSGTGHACSACGAFYASRDGIALFGVTEEFYGELSLDEMKEFLALAEHGRFEDAVSSYLASRNPVLKDTILSPKRINWLQLFKVTGKEVVLDYGCGLGAVSFQLSKFVQEVIALDGCYERIRCLQIRAHQHHINNITLVLNGDPASLPIPSESVDLIVLSLVFIYLHCSLPSLDRTAAEQVILKEMLRVLKPGGYLYLADRNKYAMYSIVRGLREVGFKDARSYRGYKRILESSGFQDVRFNWLVPDYKFPEYIIPLDQKHEEVVRHIDAVHLFSEKRKRFLRFLSRTGILRYVADTYAIVMRKPGPA